MRVSSARGAPGRSARPLRGQTSPLPPTPLCLQGLLSRASLWTGRWSASSCTSPSIPSPGWTSLTGRAAASAARSAASTASSRWRAAGATAARATASGGRGAAGAGGGAPRPAEPGGGGERRCWWPWEWAPPWGSQGLRTREGGSPRGSLARVPWLVVESPGVLHLAPLSFRFSVNKRIFVVGFGLYGSIHGPTDYQVNIQVLRAPAPPQILPQTPPQARPRPRPHP